MSKLPRTAGGKVDRTELASFAIDPPANSGTYTPPRNALEQQLCDIWSEVLGINEVNVFDHYLDLGADSIAAMRFNAAARKHGVPILQADVFQYETVAALAAAIISRNSESLPETAVDVSEGPFYVQR